MKKVILLICMIFPGAYFAVVSGQTTTIKKDVTTIQKVQDPNQIKKIIPVAPAVVLTAKEVKDITTTTARCLYEVMNEGGAVIVQHGVCVSKGTGPTINNSFFVPKNTGPLFSAEIINLSPATKFYVRPFAKLQSGEVIYGNEMSFTTLSSQKK